MVFPSPSFVSCKLASLVKMQPKRKREGDGDDFNPAKALKTSTASKKGSTGKSKPGQNKTSGKPFTRGKGSGDSAWCYKMLIGHTLPFPVEEDLAIIVSRWLDVHDDTHNQTDMRDSPVGSFLVQAKLQRNWRDAARASLGIDLHPRTDFVQKVGRGNLDGGWESRSTRCGDKRAERRAAGNDKHLINSPRGHFSSANCVQPKSLRVQPLPISVHIRSVSTSMLQSAVGKVV